MKFTFSYAEIKELINDLDSARVGEAETTPELLDRALETLAWLEDELSNKERRIEELEESLKLGRIYL